MENTWRKDWIKMVWGNARSEVGVTEGIGIIGGRGWGLGVLMEGRMRELIAGLVGLVGLGVFRVCKASHIKWGERGI